MNNIKKEALLELKRFSEKMAKNGERRFFKILCCVSISSLLLNILLVVLRGYNTKVQLLYSFGGFITGIIIISIILLSVKFYKGNVLGIDFLEESKRYIIFEKNSELIDCFTRINTLLIKNNKNRISYNIFDRKESLSHLDSDWYKEIKDTLKNEDFNSYLELDFQEFKVRKLLAQIDTVKKSTRKELEEL